MDKTWIYLVSSARKVWRWSKERRQLRDSSTNCAKCNIEFKDRKEKEIDHIKPIGKAPRSVPGDAKSFKGWDKYYGRMFVGKDKLQALCHKCHLEKTREERKK